MSEREYVEAIHTSDAEPRKVMVCISASPFSEHLIRIAHRLTDYLQTDLVAVYVETSSDVPMAEQDYHRLALNLRLAEDLGAEVVTVTGDWVSEAILAVARDKQVKDIIIGKPMKSRLSDWIHGSVVNQLIRKSEDIRIHVIPGQTDRHDSWLRTIPSVNRGWKSYVTVALFVMVLTVLLYVFNVSRDLVNSALVYLLPVLVSAVRWGLGPAIFASAMGLLAFDFFFVPPIHSFTVADLRYLVSFAVFLGVAVLTASLASRLRVQLQFAKEREASTAALYALSRQMTAVSSLNTILRSIVKQVSAIIGSEVVIFLGDNVNELERVISSVEGSTWGKSESDYGVARWVYSHGVMAGSGTLNLRQLQDLYLPLKTDTHVHGVLGIRMAHDMTADKLRLLEALAGLSAMAISRIKLEENAKIAHLTAESERLRTALLDSISHELRTPLAAIIGSVTGLIDSGEKFSPEDRRELLFNIRDASLRMNRLVTNLLGMVRLESGMLRLNKQWCDLQDIVGVALEQVNATHSNRKITVVSQDDLPPVPVDDVLMEQVLVNLLSNAIKYSPDDSEIVLSLECNEDSAIIRVADNGVGIAAGEHEKVFDKFYRIQSGLKVPGTGLGLAICKGIVEAHGGTITAAPNRDQGTVFTVTLPLTDAESH